MRTGNPLWVTEGADLAGTGDTFAIPWNLNGDPKGSSNQKFSAGNGLDDNYWFDKTVFSRPAAGTYGNGPRNNIYGPGQYQWDIALFKNVNAGGSRNFQFRAEIFDFPNHANLNNPETNPTNAQFGRVTGKDGLSQGHPAEPAVPVLAREIGRSSSQGGKEEGRSPYGFLPFSLASNFLATAALSDSSRTPDTDCSGTTTPR